MGEKIRSEEQSYIPSEEEVEKSKKRDLECLEELREKATPLQKEVAEGQSLKYETMLLNLMRKTEGRGGENANVELINKMNRFIDSMASYGDAGEGPLEHEVVRRLNDFFEKANKDLHPSEIFKNIR